MNSIPEIANIVRQQYLKQFLEEYGIVKHKISNYRTHNELGIPYQYLLVTDCELTGNVGTVKYKDIVPDHLPQKHKLHRYDMILFRDNKPVKPFMCWPVLSSADDGFLEEDIPFFLPYTNTINNTLIEIFPFPWFFCNVKIYPKAENVKGILDLWFLHWFYNRRKTNTIQSVVHGIDGPYREKDGAECYQIDFGTAPAESFCNLIYNIARHGIEKIVIK